MEDSESGRVMLLTTDQPGMQLFTANGFPEEGAPPIVGKDGANYFKHGAFCFEAQNYPDAVNHVTKHFLKRVLLKLFRLISTIQNVNICRPIFQPQFFVRVTSINTGRSMRSPQCKSDAYFHPNSLPYFQNDIYRKLNIYFGSKNKF